MKLTDDDINQHLNDLGDFLNLATLSKELLECLDRFIDTFDPAEKNIKNSQDCS